MAHINRGPDISTHSIDLVKCSTCHGVGAVSDEMLRRIALGKARRDKRVAEKKSLNEAARELGIGPAELSAIEQGRGSSQDYT